MISGLHIGTNFRKFAHGTLPPLALVAIMLIPLLFGGLFVWAYYDPLGTLNKMPVALVTSDQGATGPDGQAIHAGEDVTERLLEQRPLDFRLVSAEEARRGIADGTYYLGVEIPTDFSAAAVSVNSENLHQAKLNVTLNETNGFIPTMLGQQASTIMTSTISDTISRQVVNQLFVGFNTLGDGLDQASDGAGKLSAGMAQLQAGTGRLGDGASQVAGGVDTIASVAAQLGEAQRAYGDIAAATNPEVLQKIQLLQSGAHQVADQLNDPTAQYRSGVDQAAEGAQALANGLSMLRDGSGTLLAGVAKLKDGSSQLVVGAHAAADGSSRLASGSDQLVVGLGTLNDGLVQLDVGSGELSLKFGEGASQAPRWEGARLDAVTFFGRGLSPFVLSLSAWIGGLALFMVYSPFSRRAIDSGMHPARALLPTLLPGFVVGFAQAALLWLVQVALIDVQPAHPLGLFGVLWFVSWVFVSVILAINMVFGAAAGKLVTMALMSLQLVASNGLYPPEVQPAFIRWVHSWDPMRFSVDLLRHALFGTWGGDPRPWRAVAVLTLLAAASWVIAAAGMYKHRVISAKDRHPELSV